MSSIVQAIPMHLGISCALRYPVPLLSSSISELKKFSDIKVETALALYEFGVKAYNCILESMLASNPS